MSMVPRNSGSMKTTSIDPLIPLNETDEETLTRLSADIGTLTGLMEDAERVGHYYLAAMFNRARDAKVAQAEGIIALATAGSPESANDRRFELVRDSAPIGGVPQHPRRRAVRSSVQLALTQ